MQSRPIRSHLNRSHLKKLFLLIFCYSGFISSIPVSRLRAFYQAGIPNLSVLPIGLVAAAIDRKENIRERENIFEEMGLGLEKIFRDLGKIFPWYWYISKPVYRATGGRDLPLVSVPMSFAVTDLVMHRALAEILALLTSRDNRIRFKSEPWLYLKRELIFDRRHRYGFFAWTLLSVPIAWHKHLELKYSQC